MPVQQTIPFEEGTFFITLTCHKWMNLIETTSSQHNGKRFMAYDIVKRLKSNGKNDVLSTLSRNVEAKRKANNKQHEVWELSFDWKYCNSYKFIKQKLDYMHNNPCTGKWNLCESPIDYLHSSAKYYAGELGNYEIDMMEKE